MEQRHKRQHSDLRRDVDVGKRSAGYIFEKTN